ncbi:MAG TPA: SMP-30/gluconolactonase/LRE family protein [Dehalococcoidia bacterium]|nr:SMP-30/gluconolactonase/LRE family protein [Dehalococcoidia bacterium]
MQTLNPDVLVSGLGFPECPRWHQGRLWLSDMNPKNVLTVEDDGRTQVQFTVAGTPAGLGFRADGSLLVVSMGDRRLLRWDGRDLAEVADLSGLERVRINDLVADAAGRAYIGGFGYDREAGEPRQAGNVYLVTPDGAAHVAVHGPIFPNGLAITPDGRRLIVAETFGRCLSAYDIAEDGSLSNGRLFADLGKVWPDGICLDAEGGVWLGSPPTGEFLRVLEGGEVTHRVPVAGKWAVACLLGGEDRRTLYLCTARATEEERSRGEGEGWIEVVRVDIPGAGRP